MGVLGSLFFPSGVGLTMIRKTLRMRYLLDPTAVCGCHFANFCFQIMGVLKQLSHNKNFLAILILL